MVLSVDKKPPVLIQSNWGKQFINRSSLMLQGFNIVITAATIALFHRSVTRFSEEQKMWYYCLSYIILLFVSSVLFPFEWLSQK